MTKFIKKYMKDLNIRHAKTEEIQIVENIVKSCAENALLKDKVKIWSGYTHEKIQEKFENTKILLLLENIEVVGIASLSSTAPAYFYKNHCGENGETIDFLEYFAISERPCYLSMFGIDPKVQKTGYGTEFLKLIENWAIGESFDSLRIDVNEVVPGLIQFYEKRGFTKLQYSILNAGINSWLMERLSV